MQASSGSIGAPSTLPNFRQLSSACSSDFGEFEMVMCYQPVPGDYQFFPKVALDQGPGCRCAKAAAAVCILLLLHTSHRVLCSLREGGHHGGPGHWEALLRHQRLQIPEDLRPTYDWTSQIFTVSDREQVRVGVYGWAPMENTRHWDKFSFARGDMPPRFQSRSVIACAAYRAICVCVCVCVCMCVSVCNTYIYIYLV